MKKRIDSMFLFLAVITAFAAFVLGVLVFTGHYPYVEFFSSERWTVDYMPILIGFSAVCMGVGAWQLPASLGWKLLALAGMAIGVIGAVAAAYFMGPEVQGPHLLWAAQLCELIIIAIAIKLLALPSPPSS